MSDPMAGTREFRTQTAREALDTYQAWASGPADPVMIGSLASCARWLLEMLGTGQRAAAPETAAKTTGAANTAVAHLDSRGMREVLNFLALHDPDAVLLAVRETGA